MRLLAALAMLVAAIAAGVLWVWHENTAIRYTRDRAKLEWLAAILADRVQAVGTVPDKWAAGFFLSNKSLSVVTGALKGTTVRSQNDDVTITFDDLTIQSQSTFVEVAVALSAASPSRNVTLKARAVAELVFAGTKQTDPQTASLQFRLVPIEIVPEIGWYGLDWRGGKFASDLISSNLLASMIDSAPIMLPIQNGMSVDLGEERNGTIPINKDLGSTLTYSLTIPNIRLAGSLPAMLPLFLKNGLWLLASETPIEGSDASPNADGISAQDLTRQTSEIRARIDAVSTPASDAAVWISSQLLLSALGRVATLPLAERRLSFRSTKIDGQIAKKDWSDDILGKGGAFAEFVDDNSLKGAAVLARLAPSWEPGKGIHIETSIDVDADAKVHVHVDPLIGGGVGTTMGLVGKASAKLSVGVTFTIDKVDNIHVLVARPVGSCRSVKIDLRTDGTAKTDFGWTKVPSVGIVREQPVDLGIIAPISIFDDLPRTVDSRDKDGQPLTVATKDRVLTVEPAWRYLNATIEITKSEATTTGWLLAANSSMTPANAPVDTLDVTNRRAKIKDTVSKPGKSTCTSEGSTAVTLGNLEFGPNNELVKFFVSVGKLTQQMADRIGNEVNQQKLKEWVNDPAGSFARSDPGKIAKGATGIVTKPVEDFCAHNPCPKIELPKVSLPKF
ncbi:hypothetical protein RFM99_25725 [Mesorhizobium sp. VK4C]|uniref:hypothetical protein n=1 Tax=Mesorhizobium captivum TaxID=3072319 RepID=UPI002A244146|nr:hypothetical protein [Mesorhizobium sp. VK4C]MDX8501801.1 hypothetical protein [Mesorhizobium sp. VK4C]